MSKPQKSAMGKKPRINMGVLARVVKLLIKSYPVLIPITAICIVLSALVSFDSPEHDTIETTVADTKSADKIFLNIKYLFLYTCASDEEDFNILQKLYHIRAENQERENKKIIYSLLIIWEYIILFMISNCPKWYSGQYKRFSGLLLKYYQTYSFASERSCPLPLCQLLCLFL